MSNIVIKKWIEPYVLLETFKSNFNMKEVTFDGFTKNNAKKEMQNILDKDQGKTFALYMKNVNKFYIFVNNQSLNIEKFLYNKFSLAVEDYSYCPDFEQTIEFVDKAKGEAVIIF